MGIELKTKESGPLQTLFSRTPSRYMLEGAKSGMFRSYSRFDSKRNRRSLYTSFSNSPDSFGFSLQVESLIVKVCAIRK